MSENRRRNPSKTATAKALEPPWAPERAFLRRFPAGTQIAVRTTTHFSGVRHVCIAQGQDRRSVRRARLRQEPGQEREGAQEGLHQAALARRGGRWLRVRRRQDRAAAGGGRGAPGAWPDRLRGQLVG